jgi:hypothetical protein
MLIEQKQSRGDHAFPLFAMLVLGIWWQLWMIEQMEMPSRQTPEVGPIKVLRLADERMTP